MASLSAWLDGDHTAAPELGPITPVKHWLVRILRHRLELYGSWSGYVAGVPAGKSGAGPASSK